AAARVVLYGDRGPLGDQTDALVRSRHMPPELVPTRTAEPDVPDRQPVGGLAFFNGTGGFTADGREYVVAGTPPAPWANVIANPVAGCVATDAGPGYTWVGNSQANRLTPWSNDPVSDPPAEVVYVRDEETGHFWTPTPRPAGPAALPRVGLSDHTGPGLDPCAALMGRFAVPPGGATEVVFVIGQAADATTAGRLATRYRDPATAAAALQDVITAWDRRLSAV